MNTVKLPPLPDPHCGPNYHTDGFALFLDDQMQAYATQAVEADRAERQREAVDAAIPLDKDELAQLIAEHLGDTYHCTRVWEAWNVGTMGQDDFKPVDESDTPAELADAVLALFTADQMRAYADRAARATADSVLEDAETALRKVLGIVQRHLPPDGPSAHDSLSEIIEIVDPWPLGPLEKP